LAGRSMRVLYMAGLLTGILAQAPNPIQLLDLIAGISSVYQDSSR